ncbi:hypothetical protein ACP275_10G041500 [Erythranthe tilingii]
MPPPAKLLCFLIFAAASAIAPATGVDHSTPAGKLKKRHASKHPPPAPAFVPVFNWEQQEYLKAHNDLRQKVGVPPLVWSPALTKHAHAWAEHRRVDCNYRSHSPYQFGENIYWESYNEFTPTDVVQWWFNEYKLYDNETLSCLCQPERAGCECGHYLNVVWSTTTRVGCSGAVYCDNQNGVYVVCEYDPPGLIPGINPFNGSRILF